MTKTLNAEIKKKKAIKAKSGQTQRKPNKGARGRRWRQRCGWGDNGDDRLLLTADER